MPDCACVTLLDHLHCERFADHIRERVTAGVVEKLEAARQEEEREVERILYGAPGGSVPSGVIRG